MINLENKKILITGATGGIGKEISKILHKCGATLYLSGSSFDKLDYLSKELGSNSTLLPCDLSKVDKIEEMMNTIDQLDGVICNAGINRDNLALRMSDEDFNEVIEINLKANFIINKLAIKKMLRKRFGRIINIASVVAFTGNYGQANYVASKAGLVGMSKVFALEVANKDITVNVIAPGFITSNMTDKMNEQQKDYIMQKIPQKKFGKGSDIANVAAFLASDLSSYITGQTIHVNGGMFMN